MTFWQHKFKCLKCGLHFIVCSDFKDWPKEGTTNYHPEAPYCPECGRTGRMLGWSQETEGAIFQAVPGGAEMTGLSGPHCAPSQGLSPGQERGALPPGAGLRERLKEIREGPLDPTGAS